jgi:hypothetical protein
MEKVQWRFAVGIGCRYCADAGMIVNGAPHPDFTD